MTSPLLPCPWCAAGETLLKENGKMWTGQQYSAPASVSVQHWCAPVEGQPSRMIERVGRDAESAIAAWNRRAAAPTQEPPEQPAGREAVASIYITPDGEREMDDWRHDLPVGRNLLYTAPIPAPTHEPPVAWLDSFGEPHRRREDAWDGEPESAEPRPLYTHPAPHAALLADANIALAGAANYIDNLGGVSQSYRQLVAKLDAALKGTTP